MTLKETEGKMNRTDLDTRLRIKKEAWEDRDEDSRDRMVNTLIDEVADAVRFDWLPNGDLKMRYNASDPYENDMQFTFAKVFLAPFPRVAREDYILKMAGNMEDKVKKAEAILPTFEHALAEAEDCIRGQLEAGDTVEEVRRTAGNLPEGFLERIAKDEGVETK